MTYVHTYYQKIQAVKAKEGELPNEIVMCLTDITAKWLKEYETRAKVIDMIVMEHFITMQLGEIRAWVEEYKAGMSMIAGKLAEDF